MDEHKTGFSTKFAAISLILTITALGAMILRPPGAGRVYHFRSDQYGLQGSTALLLRNQSCLVLSRSKEDIGRTVALPGSEKRLLAIAATDRIRSGRDKSGLYMIDTKTGLVARPGDAIDAEILFRGEIGKLNDAFRAGWRLDDSCGSGLAVVFSITRVHR